MLKRSNLKERLFLKSKVIGLKTGLVLTLALTVGLLLPRHFTVTLTPSLSHRIFFLSAVDKNKIRRGDYLLFRKESPWNIEAPENMVKEVGCVGGDRLRVINNEYFCNGFFLGKALSVDSDGKRLDTFLFNGKIPEGSLFMIGDHPRSYDSKYYGFINWEDVKFKAHPIF